MDLKRYYKPNSILPMTPPEVTITSKTRTRTKIIKQNKLLARLSALLPQIKAGNNSFRNIEQDHTKISFVKTM